MKALVLQRDDSFLNFSFIVSVILHCFLLLLIYVPSPRVQATTDYINETEVTYTSFPDNPYFQNFSRDKIYTSAKDGLSVPTSGEVKVKPQELNATKPETLREQRNNDVTPVENRQFIGQAQPAALASAGGQVTPSRQPRRSGLDLPDGPDEMVRDDQPSTDRRIESDPDFEARAGSPGRLISSRDQPSAVRTPSPGGSFVRGAPQPTSRPSSPARQGRPDVDPRFTEVPSAGPTTSEVIKGPPSPPATPGQSPSTRTPVSGKRKLLAQPLPSYPEWAERDQVQAKATFDIIVTPDGKVSKAFLATTSGYGELDRLAENSVRRWIYEPRPGQAEERRVTVNFVLKR